MVVTASSMLLICVIIVLVAYILLYAYRFRLYKASAKFPGPPTLPFIGNGHYFLGNTQDILNKCTKIMENYPSPIRIWPIDRLLFMVYDPEQLKAIFSSPHTIDKETTYRFLKPWMGDGIFTAPGPIWKVHRKLINPAFNTRILDSFVKTFSEKSEILIREMEVEVNGKEFDIWHYVSMCSYDTLIETVMGVPSDVQTSKNYEYERIVNRLTEIVYLRMFQFWIQPDFIFYRTKLGKEMQENVKKLHQFTDDVIKQKKQLLQKFHENNENAEESYSNNNTKKNFLDLLMELSHEGNKLTDKQLRDEVNTMIFGGTDTTITADCFSMLMLASHPEIQEKVYEELCEIYGSEDPCATPVKIEDLHRMEYLERVIKETLRLFPVAPIVARQVTEDVNIGEFTLPKGSSLVLGLMFTHRSEKYWDDPLTFNPDRFLPEEFAKQHPYAYVPYTAGPRVCIGMNYAMRAMKVLLATVVRKYVLIKDNIVPIKDIKLKASLTVKTAEPMTIRIEKRIHKSSN